MCRSSAPGRLTPLPTARNTLIVQRQPITSSSSRSTRPELSFGMIAKNFLSLVVINLHRFVGIPPNSARFRVFRTRSKVRPSSLADERQLNNKHKTEKENETRNHHHLRSEERRRS